MIPEIFDIEDGKVVINPNCLLIPELKQVHDAYKDPIPAFCFLHYKFKLNGPYANVPEEDKEEILMEDFPGEYTSEDNEIISAVQKLTELNISATVRYYLDSKILMEKMGSFARTSPITTGRDGNFGSLFAQLRNVGKTINEFKILEKTVIQELSDKGRGARGKKKLAYDDI